ncbi:MAG: CpsD/CapB family tyrosine-protein kinase [Actinobacteria bacterium]|nr:CpsD/CapB family tyrosine-protein kinase [Actinomycetota bacterium]
MPESELRAFIGETSDRAGAEADVDSSPKPPVKRENGPAAIGTSLGSVAEWFGVSEPQLRALMGDDWPEAEESLASTDGGVEARLVPSPAPVEKAPGRRTSRRSSSEADDTTRPSRPTAPRTFQDAVQVLQRRLLVVVVGVIVGVSAGWVTAPGETRRVTTFRATHTLIYEPQGTQSYNIEQVALLATSGEVPSRVAAKLQLDRGQVRGAVSAVASTAVSTIAITATARDAAGAVSLADTTAEELSATIEGGALANYQAEVARLTGQVDAARNQLTTIPPKNTAALAQAQAGVDNAGLTLEQYKSSQAPKKQLRTLESATASAVNPAGVRAPNSKPIRAGLLGVLGALAAVAGAFALDRLDTRIRSKAAAEAAFGAPVVAEVPAIPKSARGELLVRSQPSSPFVEAYRGLRTYVALWTPNDDRDDGHRVIVVTSPAAGEGKTTTVAHLAALLAEIGRSVVVVSADLRRPRLHHYFDVPGAPGLVDVLGAKSGPPVFAGLDQPTPVRGVRFVPSGPPVENPAALFEHAGSLLSSVRGLAEFVLVDAPPLLVANDAVEMARYADGVLLVARAGETPIEAAQRSAETLERLEIPVVGTVLIGSEAASSASRYYASRYYAEPERAGRRSRRRAGGDAPAVGVQAPGSEESQPVVTGS